MTSVLPDLERDLVAAASRHTTAHANTRDRIGGLGSWLRGRSRTAQIVLGLIVASAAAASAATLLGTASLPLSGAISPSVRYRIALTPQLYTGSVGWCISDQQSTHTGRLLAGAARCGPGTAALGSPLFEFIPGPTAAVVTSPQVAAVQIANGPTILTRGDAQLPYGFRAAVFATDQKLGNFADPPKLVALDARGRPIPGGRLTAAPPRADGDVVAVLPTRAWAVPGAGAQLSGFVRSFPHDGQPVARTPPEGSCSTIAAAGSGLRARGGVDVTAIVGDPAIIGHAFLDCSDTLYAGHGSPTVVSVLLDAKHPGAIPAALPNMTAVRGHAALYTLPGGGIGPTDPGAARLVGDAWLIASGGSSVAQKLWVLGHIGIASLDLSAPPVSPSGPRGVPCSIAFQPMRGLLETIQTPWHGPPPAWGPNPRLYPCTAASFYLNNWPLQARVFAPIRQPGTPHHPVLHPIPGHPGVFSVGVNGYTGPGLWRSVGRAWLVITGGSGTQQRLALSDRLSAQTSKS